MIEAGIGRLLVASLHQGIADVKPGRLEFYENWLSPRGLSDGRLGLAPLGAVLSFLRLEGQGTYEAVMTSAGRHSASWTLDGASGVERVLVRSLPSGLRLRLVLRLARRLVRDTFRGARATVRVRRDEVRLDIRESIFCRLREATTAPMCTFYAVAVEHLLALCQLDAVVTIRECRAPGGQRCSLGVTLRGLRGRADAEAA